MTKSEIEARIAEIRSTPILVETNSGTFGAVEAGRKVGCGDPRFATRNVYAWVDGRRSAEGPSEERAPGRMRRFSGALAEAHGEIAKLLDEAKSARD